MIVKVLRLSLECCKEAQGSVDGRSKSIRIIEVTEIWYKNGSMSCSEAKIKVTRNTTLMKLEAKLCIVLGLVTMLSSLYAHPSKLSSNP